MKVQTEIKDFDMEVDDMETTHSNGIYVTIRYKGRIIACLQFWEDKDK